MLGGQQFSCCLSLPFPAHWVSARPLHGGGRRAPPVSVNREPQPPARTASTFPQPPPISIQHWPTADSSMSILLLSTRATSCLNRDSQPPTKMPHEAPREAAKPLPGSSHAIAERRGPGQATHCRSRWIQLPPHPPLGVPRVRLPSEGSVATLLAPARPRGEPPLGRPLVIARSQKRPKSHALVSAGRVTALPQGIFAPKRNPPPQQEPRGQPDPCARSGKPVASPGGHRNSLLPARPRLSPSGALPSLGSATSQLRGVRCSSWPKAEPKVSGGEPPALRQLWEGGWGSARQSPRPCKMHQVHAGGKSGGVRSSQAFGLLAVRKAAFNSRQHARGCRSICKN
ncbi:splicing factor, proline- and glutamine-rich-like isoform X2 [Falco naumanni]|uniref:splicing factor, proline- and glutamine-rich-like isoform X2 n=1 Tax=Falco naumanni TaxID=148594 RepID=UPI001ADE32BD|nr:splicing factor, proline- and glutamine-rich-like isoform X2 [Falco naumanni]